MRKQHHRIVAARLESRQSELLDWIKHRYIDLVYLGNPTKIVIKEYISKVTAWWEIYWDDKRHDLQVSRFRTSLAYCYPIIEVIDGEEYKPIVLSIKKTASLRKNLYIEHSRSYSERAKKSLS
jgi:hypothetical protein